MITEVKRVLICRLCGRDLEATYSGKCGAAKALALRCPRHGTLDRGERFLTGYGAKETGIEGGNKRWYT